MLETITFLGYGSWSAALCNVLAHKGYDVTAWHRNQDIIDEMVRTKCHYLIQDLKIHPEINILSTDSELPETSSIVVIGVPCQSFRYLVKQFKAVLSTAEHIAYISKGIETGTLATMSEILFEELGTIKNVICLSGPSHAEEVNLRYPTMLVSSSIQLSNSKLIQRIFSTDLLRVYTNEDIKGVELGGAIKNVIAIAAGFCDGINLGDNTKAALMTRGMLEIARLGIKMGADPNTFSGLSGFGDLFVTCSSKHSRNRKLGQSIGEGVGLSDIIDESSMVAEGVQTSRSVYKLSRKHDVELPICEAVYKVLFEELDPHQAIKSLMTRKLKEERFS